MLKFGWLALLVACGGGGSRAADARGGNGDASGAIDAAHGDTSGDAAGCGDGAAVTATGPALAPGSTEQLTITAVSHDASGAYCGRTTATGPSAHLTIDVPPGGMLTLVAASDMREQHTFTWTRVQPGDDLIFPSLIRHGVQDQLVHVQLTVPALAGASNNQLFIVCEHYGVANLGSVPVGPLSTDIYCETSAQSVIAWIEATTSQGVEYAVGDVTPIASSGATAISIGAWAAPATPTTTITGATDFQRADLGFSPGLPPDPFGSEYLQMNPLDAGATTFEPQPLPAPLPGDVEYRVTTTDTRALVIHRPYTAPPPSVDLSVDADFLPAISASLDAGLPRPRMSWNAARPVAGIDIAFVRTASWIVATDGTSDSVLFPELPPDLVPTDTHPLYDVDLIESPELNGYDDVRADPLRAYFTHEHRITSAGWLNGGTF